MRRGTHFDPPLYTVLHQVKVDISLCIQQIGLVSNFSLYSTDVDGKHLRMRILYVVTEKIYDVRSLDISPEDGARRLHDRALFSADDSDSEVKYIL